MRTAIVSGWGQPPDALAAIAPDARAVHYVDEPSVDAALAAIADQTKDADLIIGWSLGGQLAARAIAEKKIKPRRLVLIASAFQFVANQRGELGMERFTFDKFRHNFEKNPARTLDKSWELISMHDTHSRRVLAALAAQDKSTVLQKDWLRWLDLLDGFSFEKIPLSNLPPTLILHGENDVVVEIAQSERFAEAIPNAELITFAGCGHAPHWHDSAAVQKAIAEFAHV